VKPPPDETTLRIRCWVCTTVSVVGCDVIILTPPAPESDPAVSFVCPACLIRSERLIPLDFFERLVDGQSRAWDAELRSWADMWLLVEFPADLGMAG
jgi:hypothetical protein